MSIHKLSAGSGYDYLTRQVAALDATGKGHVGLASYYTERGESPGSWIGSGMAGIDGLSAGDPVTAEQMRSLFGAGIHPLAAQQLEQLDAADLTDTNVTAATQLGAPFKIYAGDVSPFRVEVAKRIAAQQAARQLGDEPVSAAFRAWVRTEVAREFFRAEHGRDPIDAREIAATIAKGSRPHTQTVAGYDLTFSPVKSVSTLWAVADPHVAAKIEQAHQAAARDALTFIERQALFTRQGRNGVRQVNVRGLVAAAFTHRDSRAGDPDLHTHVAVANKVETLDGCWLSIDGRVLFKATVAASETYNTALEHHLRDRLGVQFAERTDSDPGKRPVREIVGVDPALSQRWSSRRVLIKDRQGELAAQFQRDHGRPPTPVEALQLAQQATLETRDAKHEPRSLAEQRNAWYAQAVETLGGPEAIEAMISKALNPTSARGPALDREWVAATAEKVLAAVEEHRSTWQSWHVRAEAQRHLRGVQLPTDKVDQLVELLIEDVLHTRSVALTRTEDISEPEALRRADGSSVYTVAGSELFTSARILEQILARDASPQSASTLLREQQDPAVRLGAATARYLDALYVAADHLARPEMIANLDSAERVFGGLTSEPAWPTVRGQILLVAAGADPVTEPFSAAATRDMTSADDHVEVIDWHTGVAGGGPLPWLPGIPHRLAADPNWGPYLNARSDLVAQLADQVRGNAAEAPAWATQHHALTAELIADIQVWRAATQVEPSDLRPTGPPQLGYSARLCQQQLDKRLAATDTDTEWRWRQLFAAEVPCVTADLFLPELAERLTNLTRAGYDATQLVRSAAAAGPLPDDHPAAALWWRILDQLPQTQPATPKAVPATRRTTAPAPRPRLKPPPAFGPSR